MRIDLQVETAVSRSARARQLEAIFDVPAGERSRIEFKGDFPIEDREWQVGLIVGPSGSGKSTILKNSFAEPRELEWGQPSVIDDFAEQHSIKDIAAICQAVGFNTIPAWLRPFGVLSNGERFRVELARRMLEAPKDEIIAVDEFTSVVDRQVAQIGSHAVQKYVRQSGKKFVAASCHYDIVEWLQPDWVLEPATMKFTWRSLQRRPAVECELARVKYETWAMFAPFHYLTADLNKAANCFALLVNGRAAAFAGVLHRPHPRVKDIMGVSRLVTLPDFQGLGLAFALVDRLGAIFRACGKRLHTYPAHPALVRGFDKSVAWSMVKKPGVFSPKEGANSRVGGFGGRPCAVFQYAGPAHADVDEAKRLISREG